jgi:hypothetical protein
VHAYIKQAAKKEKKNLKKSFSDQNFPALAINAVLFAPQQQQQQQQQNFRGRKKPIEDSGFGADRHPAGHYLVVLTNKLQPIKMTFQPKISFFFVRKNRDSCLLSIVFRRKKKFSE